MAVHTVCHKTLGIIYVCRGFPGIVCEPDFVTPCAELGRGGAHHCVIRDAEEGKRNHYAKRDKDDRPNNLPQTQIIWERFRWFHLSSSHRGVGGLEECVTNARIKEFRIQESGVRIEY